MSASLLHAVDIRNIDFLRSWVRPIDTDSVICNSDIQAQILSRMSLGALCKASSLNREWAAACEPFWKRLCTQRWPECAQLHIISYRSFFCRRMCASRAQPQQWASIDAEDLCFLVDYMCGGGICERTEFVTENYAQRQHVLPLGAQYNEDGSVPRALIDDAVFSPLPWRSAPPAINPDAPPWRRIPLLGPQCCHRYKVMHRVASCVLKASDGIWNGSRRGQDAVSDTYNFVWDIPCEPVIDDWFAMEEFGLTVTIIAFRQSDQKMCTLLRDARCDTTSDGSKPYFECSNGEAFVPILKNRELSQKSFGPWPNPQHRETFNIGSPETVYMPAKDVAMEVGVSLDLKSRTREQAPRDHTAGFSLYVNLYDENWPEKEQDGYGNEYYLDNSRHMPNVEECLRLFAQLEWK